MILFYLTKYYFYEYSSEDEGDINKILNWKVSLTKIVFSEPNDHLLS